MEKEEALPEHDEKEDDPGDHQAAAHADEEGGGRIQVRPHRHRPGLVEGAHGPTTPAGDERLRERGLRVVPDILANAGGVTVSYYEWLQGRNRREWDRERVITELDRDVESAWQSVVETAETHDCSWRTSATGVALRRLAEAHRARGRWP